jgi:hypothetical protein
VIGILERCRTVLGNMALEREGFWASFLGRRWPIHHEPLRNDARSLIPLIDSAIVESDRMLARLLSLAMRLDNEPDREKRDIADDIRTILSGEEP